MSEANSVKTFRDHTKRAWPLSHFQRIEDKFGIGIPDINMRCPYGDFWIEGKYIKKLPVRETTFVKPGDFTQEQAIWLHTRARAGGRAGLLVRVENKYWALYTKNFVNLVQGAPLAEFLEQATVLQKQLNVEQMFKEWVDDQRD